MPDDGNRYELVEGEIVMTPAPSAWHQLISARLHHVLTQHAPEGLVVLAAPLDTVLGSSVVEPDLVVCRLDQLVEKGL